MLCIPGFLIRLGRPVCNLLHTEQAVCQRHFGQKRVLPGQDAVWSPEIETVGETWTDLLVFPDPEQVFAAILVGKDDIIAVPEGLQPDVRAGALQHIVGSFLGGDGFDSHHPSEAGVIE